MKKERERQRVKIIEWCFVRCNFRSPAAKRQTCNLQKVEWTDILKERWTKIQLDGQNNSKMDKDNARVRKRKLGGQKHS